jgi:hypothetical protein
MYGKNIASVPESPVNISTNSSSSGFVRLMGCICRPLAKVLSSQVLMRLSMRAPQ